MNVDGLGDPSKDANTELKIRDVCGMVHNHDIVVLVETRTNKLDRMMPHLPGYALHNINITNEHEGKKAMA